MTAEQLPIGLLTAVGSALSVSEGTAGLMVTVPSLVAAVAAPLVPVLVRGMDRRVLLLAPALTAPPSGSPQPPDIRRPAAACG